MAGHRARTAGFIGRLIAADDTRVDSVAFASLVALFALIGFQGWALVAQKAEFSPISFSGGVGAIVGMMSSGKAIRDRFSTPPAPPANP